MTTASFMVVLGIDQAAESGWCIWPVGRARPVEFGVLDVTDFAARDRVVRRAQAHALEGFQAHTGRLMLLFVYEEHGRIPLTHFGKKRGTPQILGLGAALAYWRESLARQLHPKRLQLGVEPRVWRKKVFGHSFGSALKDEARCWATQLIGQPVDNHNVAEAVAIAAYGVRDGVAAFFAEQGLQRAKDRAKRLSRKDGSRC